VTQAARASFVFLLATVGLSCRDRPSPTEQATNSRSTSLVEESLPPLQAGLTLRLTPRPERSQIDVEVHIVGPEAASTKELAIARQWAGIDGYAAIRSLRVRDARGEIPTHPGPDAGPDRTFELERSPQREHLEIRYAVASAPANAPRFALHVDRERFSGVGHTFLLLPRLDKPTAVHVQIRSNSLSPGASGATSFGTGDEIDARATTREMAHAAFASGRMRTIERSDAERLVIVGNPAFDAQAAYDAISSAHRALERTFATGVVQTKPDRFSYVVITEPGLGKGHDGALLGKSFALWMGNDAPFDASMIIAATHELAHTWMGGTVRLVNDQKDEQAWFSEGFAVHYARKVALAEKLVAPDDFAADLERTLGPGVSDSFSHPITGTREAYQRGALYAARIDAAIQKSSKGKRSLDDVLKKLFSRRSSASNISLPVSEFRDLVVEELGAGAGEELSWVMVQGNGEIRLDDDTFGKCFHRRRSKAKVFELGFDRRSLKRVPQMIRGLIPGSAAARAGLVEGAIVLSSKLPNESESDYDKPVEIVVAAPRGSKKIRYLPMAEHEDIQWAAKNECSD